MAALKPDLRALAPALQRELLAWFDANKRDLPWRRDPDPYRVWLSEIMLQQTRVAAVIDHYNRFLQRFPTIEKLAAARLSSVLAAWSGLGYYRRARMLHQAAREIVHHRKGQFPLTAAEWLELPGIGRYTSAAIASIAFGEPVAVVDGNVERVLQRVCGKPFRGEAVWQAATELLGPARPGDFNQALMELGATLCSPAHPKCLACPIATMCVTRGELDSQPTSVRQRKREVHYALDARNGSVLLVRRPKDATLMPDMWELPQLPAAHRSRGSLLTLRHSITVTNYLVRVIRTAAPQPNRGCWVPKPRIARLPLTGLARKILRSAKVI